MTHEWHLIDYRDCSKPDCNGEDTVKAETRDDEKLHRYSCSKCGHVETVDPWKRLNE